MELATLSRYFMETTMLMHNRLFRHVPIPIPVNQFGALVVLINEGAVSISRLADALLVTKQQMSAIVERLNAAGYVEKKQDELDRRRTLVSLTEKGQAILDAHSNEIRKRLEKRLRQLSPEEFSHVEKGIVRFHDSIEALFH